MTANVRHTRAESFPVRGVTGGWVDPWDEPSDYAELRARAQAAERRLAGRALALGLALRQEIERERRLGERERSRRQCQRS